MFEILRMTRKKQLALPEPKSTFEKELSYVQIFLETAGINADDFEIKDVLCFLNEDTIKINLKKKIQTKGAKP